jgi:hypothetical protein
MRLQRHLNEIKITRKFELKKKSGFTGGSGRFFRRTIKIGENKYDIEIVPTKLPREYDISFGIIGRPLQILGTGNAFKVFAAVAQAIKEFLKDMNKREEPVDTLTFSANADEPSRIKLYDRFAKKFEKLFGFRLTNRDIDLYDIEYEFRRVT